jgi:hypothetical protein
MVLITHAPSFSFVGPNILLQIFLSKIINFLIIASLSTHVSEAYITTGLITVLYSLSLDRLVTNLLILLEAFFARNVCAGTREHNYGVFQTATRFKTKTVIWSHIL